jgi:UDP-N-acetylglucosamine diphosphorylase/glucosamine-1-phosphate N-acetyltransferase
MKLVIFEDRQTDHFAPLCHLRGVFELRCGASRLSDKIARAAGVEASALIARDYLAASVAQRYPIPINQLTGLSGEVLFVNARVRGAGWDAPAAETACWQGDQLAAWRTTGDVSAIDGIDALYNAAKSANRAAYDGKWFDYIWDIMIANPEEITADFVAAGKQGLHGEMHETATIFGPKENLFIGDGASIHPFVCLDTREGPITIEKGCEVHPFTRIEGPCYLGEKSILLGAKVREGCSIGPMCRVGGEVEESIIHGYSNKYHDGFLGHAYVGEWVNLGALTSNSDLKNDYTSVSVMMGTPAGGHRVEQGGQLHRRSCENQHRHPAQHRIGGGHHGHPGRHRSAAAEVYSRVCVVHGWCGDQGIRAEPVDQDREESDVAAQGRAERGGRGAAASRLRTDRGRTQRPRGPGPQDVGDQVNGVARSAL